MTVTIAPFTVNPNCDSVAPQVERKKGGHTEKDHLPITYWGIYLDDKYISYTSSRELAEKTRVWVEKWLEDRN